MRSRSGRKDNSKFYKTLSANVYTGTRFVRGVEISTGIRVRLSLALESLRLTRPSFIRVGDYSNIKTASVGFTTPTNLAPCHDANIPV